MKGRIFPGENGDWLVGELVAVQGSDTCTDPRCTRRYERGPDGKPRALPGCMGYHCPRCGEPTSMMGHDCSGSSGGERDR